MANLRYRKAGSLAWRELTPGAMPGHGEVWEVQSPDGSVTLLSRSDAPPPPPKQEPPPETDPFGLDFARSEGTPREVPVHRLGDLTGAIPAKSAGNLGAPVPPNLSGADAFGLLVEGDAFEPRFAAGQVLLAERGRPPGEGDWAVVGLPGTEARLARWRGEKRGKVRLEPPDPRAGSLEVEASRLRFACKILWIKQP